MSRVVIHIRTDEENSGFEEAFRSLRSGYVLSLPTVYDLKGPDPLDIFTHTKEVFDANCTIQIGEPRMELSNNLQSKVWLLMSAGMGLYE